MKDFLLFLALWLALGPSAAQAQLAAGAVPEVGDTRVAASAPVGVAYSCDFIDQYCSRVPGVYRKSGHRACGINYYSAEYIEMEKRSCEREQAQPLTIQNMSDRRYKAWLLAYESERLRAQGASLSETGLGDFLDLMVQAIVPVASEASVARRLNVHIDERLVLAQHFIELVYLKPAVGNDYVNFVYDLSRFDNSDDIRARSMDFLFHADRNRENVERLLEYHSTAGKAKVFTGSMSGGRPSWNLSQKKGSHPRRNSWPEETAQYLRTNPGGSLHRDKRSVLESRPIAW